MAQVEISAALVSRLIADQFPSWSKLPVKPVANTGWDNRTFHLGSEMLVRMPAATRYASQVEKEHTWLPRLATHLPVDVPTPLALGEPGHGYPWRWSVYRWLQGEMAWDAPVADEDEFARSLAGFLAALHTIPAKEGPPAGVHNFHRGGPLSVYDEQTRRAIAALPQAFDKREITEIWEEALKTQWRAAPVWVHGDFAPGNLLVRDGKLNAVIDFGTLGVGDPACDLVIAWTFLGARGRELFRQQLPLDVGTWARARGWALWKALILLSGVDSGPARDRAIAGKVLAAVLAESPRR